MNGVETIDRLLAALNAHDLDEFVACYSSGATIEDGYDSVVARGHDELRERYGPLFERFPDVRVEAGWRTTVGDFVVEAETVTGRNMPSHHVAVYLVRDGVVVRERLIA